MGKYAPLFEEKSITEFVIIFLNNQNRITSLSKLCCIICVCVYTRILCWGFLKKIICIFVRGSQKSKCNCAAPYQKGCQIYIYKKYEHRGAGWGEPWRLEERKEHNNKSTGSCTQHICLYSYPIPGNWILRS